AGWRSRRRPTSIAPPSKPSAGSGWAPPRSSSPTGPTAPAPPTRPPRSAAAPTGSLATILSAESAAAFEELTLSHGLDALKVQVPDAWPNTFRQSRFLSAGDFVQADRTRRKVAGEMARLFREVDLLLVPSLRDEMLTIS